MSSQRPINKGNFQLLFAVGALILIAFLFILITAILYDPAALAMLVPFGVVGLLFLLWWIGGKIYDRSK